MRHSAHSGIAWFRGTRGDAPSEPWLERRGWREGLPAELESDGAIVAVHIAWGDHVLAIAYLEDDVDCDPWGAVGAACGGGVHVAVRVRGGRPVFVFADDPSSRVEGPSGKLRLDALMEEGLGARVSADQYAIAMEPGVVYRTRRFGLTVTAEIVARPARLAPPKRLARVVMYSALCLAALAVGTTAKALATAEHPMLEAHADHRDDETLARLLSEAAVEAAQRPMLPSEVSDADARQWLVPSPFGLDCAFPRVPEYWRPRGIFAGLMRSGLLRRTRARVRRVRLDTWGTPSRASIARVLDRNIDALEGCTSVHGDEGAVFVYLAIDETGSVVAQPWQIGRSMTRTRPSASPR